MDQFLERGIKSIIDQFPAVGDLLSEYGIGCVPCEVGTCLLKDIVEIHDLSPDDEYDLMVRMAKIVLPGRDVTITRRQREKSNTASGPKYSPPLKKLVYEHRWIKRFLALAPRVITDLDLDDERDRKRIADSLNFIRVYADSFHHAKEEEILFKCFDEKLEILQVMLADHDRARAHVKAIGQAVQERDEDGVRRNLEAYRALLTDHITREDDILYPWMDRNLSDNQVGVLYRDFAIVDGRFVAETAECEAFILALENELT
jgi:hemerythrin-like domain-containing protein